MLKSLLSLSVAVALASVGASAGTKTVSLVTVSQGASLFEAFGHTLILVEEEGAEPVIYEFGGVEMRGASRVEAMQKLFTQLFESKIKARGRRSVTSYHSAEDAYHGAPEYLVRHYLDGAKGAKHREIRIAALDFTDAQKDSFVVALDAAISKGPYLYQNFTNNCVTQVRDILFSEGYFGRPAFFEEKQNTSFQDLSKQSIDEAIALKCRDRSPTDCHPSVSVVPEGMRDQEEVRSGLELLGTIGMPGDGEFTSSEHMQASLTEMDQSVIFKIAAKDELQTAFHEYFFGEEIARKPRTRWETTFTPKALREALNRSNRFVPGSQVLWTNDASAPGAPASPAPGSAATRGLPTGPLDDGFPPYL